MRPHSIDASRLIVAYTHTYRNPSNKKQTFTQEIIIPGPISSHPATLCTKSGSTIYPDVETSKIPRKKKGATWTPIPGASKHAWTRGKDTWSLHVFFIRLHRDSNTYQDTNSNTPLLVRDTINPNDPSFRRKDNKWILQFARRRATDYAWQVSRVHWSPSERRALYTAINTFCARHGIHNFGFTDTCKLDATQLQRMADQINLAPNPARTVARGVDAVRGQIISAHESKNGALFKLLQKGRRLREKITGGGEVSRADKFPEAAIPIEEFPSDDGASVTNGTKKRKRGGAARGEGSGCGADSGRDLYEPTEPTRKRVSTASKVTSKAKPAQNQTPPTSDDCFEPSESEDGEVEGTSEEETSQGRLVVKKKKKARVGGTRQ